MPYTIKPKTTEGFGSFGMLAGDAHEALIIVKGMAERGVEEIEILDDTGMPYDLAQLYHIANEGEWTR
jgi:hypothetical protein